MSLLTQRLLELPWSLKWGLRRQCQVFSGFMSPCTHASIGNLYFAGGRCDTLRGRPVGASAPVPVCIDGDAQSLGGNRPAQRPWWAAGLPDSKLQIGSD